MMWEIAKLGDISKNIQTGPFGSQLHQSDYSECGIPVVMPKDLVGGKISEESIATVYKGNIIKNLIMDCQSTQSTAQTRLRAVFLYHGGERRNFPRGLD